MKSSSRTVFAVILASFFLSGAAGLIYQVVWTRYLSLFLGHTSYAVIAVLVAFMGGLAIGNAWLGSMADGLRRPLFFYAWLELAVGLYAVAFPQYYKLLEKVFQELVKALQPGSGLLLTWKFLFASVAILPPTVLMGATLPALTKYMTRSLAELRGKVAALYAINSTGAVVGTLVADWWWIPSLGLEAVVQAGAVMSIAIGLVAWVMSHRTGEGLSAPAVEQPSAPETNEAFTEAEMRLAVVGIGVSGFVAMLYEVTWTRILALALGSTTHAYSLMLITFISGIAVGGWIIYRWKRQANTLIAFAWAEIALAGTLMASMFYYDHLPYWFTKLAGHLNRQPESYPVYELAQGLVCLLVMFIPAVCLGMTLPLVSRVATAELARTGRSVGRVFAVNTLGTVLGAAVTGLVLLPRLGLAATMGLGIGLNAAIGLLVLGWSRSPQWRLTKLAGPALATAGALAVASQFSAEIDRALGFGSWRLPVNPATWADYSKHVHDFEYLYHRHGAGSTVGVTKHTNGEGGFSLTLRVNGKADASSTGDMTTQLLLTHIPLLLHSNANDVLVIGCGSGSSAGAALRHPSVKRVDLVEILPEVIEAADRFFSPYNNNAFRDPRLHVAIEDAKTFLKTVPRKYDVIVTEPSNPWMAGVASVFSREFYEDCRDRLKPGGVAAQWLQAYETDDATFDMVVATFGTVFPYMSIWQTGNGDLLLLGAPNVWEPDVEATARRFAHPDVAKDLARVHLTSFPMLLALQYVAFGDAAFLPADDTIQHSDFFPRLEYAAQKAFFARRSTDKYRKVSELHSSRPRTLLGQWYAKHPFDPGEARQYVAAIIQQGLLDPLVNRSYLYRCLAMQPTNTFALKSLIEMAGRFPSDDAEMARIAQRPEIRTEEALRDVNMLRQYAGLLILGHRGQRSAFYIDPAKDVDLITHVAMQVDEQERRIHQLHLAEIFWDRGQDREFFAMASTALARDPSGARVNFTRDPDAPLLVLTRLMEYYLTRKDYNGALAMIEAATSSTLITPKKIERVPRLGMLIRRIRAESAGLFFASPNPGTQR